MLVKCKPVYNFQSLEFEMEVETKDEIQAMFDMYAVLLEGLVNVSVDQPDKVKKAPSEPLATPKQKEIMKMYGIEFTNKTTQAEATKLIQASIDKYKARQGK